MRDIVIHFISFKVMNMHFMVYWGIAAVYFMLLVSAAMSLRSLTMPTGAKMIWAMIILVLPGLGLALYALRCLVKGNWQAFEFLFQSRRLGQQIITARPGKPSAKA